MNPVSGRVLLVEDNPGDVALILDGLGHIEPPPEHQAARDGAEALALLRRVAQGTHGPMPDLVLLDLNLPKIDGLEVLREIRKLPGLERLPVVVFTGSENPLDAASVYEAGANCFVTKPAGVDEYRRCLDSIVRFWVRRDRLERI